MGNYKNKKLNEEKTKKIPKTPYYIIKQEKERQKAEETAKKMYQSNYNQNEKSVDILEKVIQLSVELGEFKGYEINEVGYTIRSLFDKNDRKKFSKKTLLNKIFEFLEVLQSKKATQMLGRIEYILAIYYIVERENFMLNDIKDWKRNSYNPDKQFKSIIDFLFVKYEMPLFMYKAWTTKNSLYIDWFVALALGNSVKKLPNLPVNLTQKMAHYFTKAPNYVDIDGAFRYAQTLGFGGNEYLAWYINASTIGRNKYKNEVFWESVIQFFAQQSQMTMFDAENIPSIVDYIETQYNINRNFSMKGRTIAALLRQSEEWHETIVKNSSLNKEAGLTWTKNTLENFEKEEGSFEKGNYQKYKITELLSAKELSTEGRRMHHCVAGYATKCAKKQTAIFTLEVEKYAGAVSDKLITIEIDLNKRMLVQARGKCNRATNDKEKQIIGLWLQENYFKISQFAWW